jgi:hypothetical protein
MKPSYDASCCERRLSLTVHSQVDEDVDMPNPAVNQQGWPQPNRRGRADWEAYAASCGSAPLARAILRLLDQDSEVLEAVDDVDESLIAYWLEMTPLQRMNYAVGTARGIAKARHV